MLMLVAFSVLTIYPPQKKIALGLDIQGGTSFLIRLVEGEKQVTKAMHEQAVEVIRKRVDYFGGGEPVISPVGNDRILVQIPGLEYGENPGSARAIVAGREARVSPRLSG